MKSLIISMAMAALKFLLGFEEVHDFIRNAAKKTENKYDDIAAEQLVEGMKKVRDLL